MITSNGIGVLCAVVFVKRGKDKINDFTDMFIHCIVSVVIDRYLLKVGQFGGSRSLD